MPLGLCRSCLLSALVLLAGAVKASAGEVRAVLELFTSQGCSSCPPADRLLGELADDPRMIPLSLNVDYWDYLGWRDTLALPAHSGRQKGYAKLRGDRQVYTPQLVANGAAEAIGNDRHAVEQMIRAAGTEKQLVVPVVLARKDSSLEIEVGDGAAPSATIWVLAVARATTVKIKRGENRGNTITYHNVVRGWTRIDDWSGARVVRSLPVADFAAAGANLAVVLIQSGTIERPGPIRGAAMVRLD
jgi:hypothetical protein